MNNQHLFRKTSLERLRSPERLDQAVQIIKPLDWLPLTALGLFILLGLVGGLMMSRYRQSQSTQGLHVPTGAEEYQLPTSPSSN